VENEENPKQVSLRFPPPLEIAAAIPTFPQPLRRVEKWKTKGRFPTFPLVVYVSQIQIRKEAWRRIAPLPPSGSFFNENMLALMCIIIFSHELWSGISRTACSVA
jgi:hypothetical protein